MTSAIEVGQSAAALPPRVQREYSQTSDVDFFCYLQRIVNLDAEVTNGGLDLGMSKQKLYRTQISRSTVDQRRLGSPQRMSCELQRVKADARHPLRDQSSILPCRQTVAGTGAT